MRADSLFNPIVLSQIVLPNGSSYTFTYDTFAEMDKLVYPTGGYERFTYGLMVPMSGFLFDPLYSQTNRGVTDQFISTTGLTADEVHWQFQTTFTGTAPTRNYQSSVIAPDGTTTTRLIYNDAYNHMDRPGPSFGFDNPLAGKIYDESVYSATGVLLRRKLTQWTVDGAVVVQGAGTLYQTRNPRVTREVEFIFDTGGDALTKTTVHTYDQDLNVIATDSYDYASVDSGFAQTVTIDNIVTVSTGALLRRMEATFLVNDPNVSSSLQNAYRTRNLIALPTSTRIKDGSGNIISQTLYSYDESSPGVITYGSVPGWTDPGPYRGNVTTVQRWLNTTGIYITTHVQYDQFGNPCVSTNA